MSDRDYYEILGLTPRADGAMVDQAYWHLARKYQALATTNSRGRHLLDDLNEAYGVLGNARLRKEYDAFRDKVLVGGGVIGAVAADPAKQPRPTTDARRDGRLAGVLGGPTYVAAVLAGGGISAAWYMGSIALGSGAAAVAAALVLLPIVRRRITLRLSMPSLPSPSMPTVSMPSVNLPSVNMPSVSMPAIPNLAMPNVRTKINLAGVGERLGRTGERDEAIDADELRASTSAVIDRWRKSMGLKPMTLRALAADEPSNDLVEIVETERQLDETDSEPLMAVIDILKGAHKRAPAPAGED